MKKSILFLLLTGWFVFQTSSATAAYIYEIKAGDRIKFTQHNSVSGAGEFKWIADTDKDNAFDDYTWQSFCIEKNEYVTKNAIYTVQGISGYAKAGGVDKNQYDSNGDPLSNETAWLYWNFSKKELTGYDSSAKYQTSLQNIIWYLEGEIKKLSTDDNSLMTAWLSGMNGWINEGQVQVVNLGAGIQDQLIVASSHAPEPGTMVLLGFGLIGLAGIGRKKLKK